MTTCADKSMPPPCTHVRPPPRRCSSKPSATTPSARCSGKSWRPRWRAAMSSRSCRPARGRSLCFQLPALVREGLTVVVSPLIALMKDQVDAAAASGVAATFLNSSLDGGEAARAARRLDAGRIPAALRRAGAADAAGFPRAICSAGTSPRSRWTRRTASASGATISARNTASSHACASDSRTSRSWRSPPPPRERVREDIVSQLDCAIPRVFLASFNRPNLTYRSSPKDKPARQVCEFVRARPERLRHRLLPVAQEHRGARRRAHARRA